jgi:hypothetical protein
MKIKTSYLTKKRGRFIMVFNACKSLSPIPGAILALGAGRKRVNPLQNSKNEEEG